MTFKVDDKFHGSPKVESIPRGAARKGAVSLWTLAGSWSDSWGRDGLIPADQIRKHDGSPKDAANLVAAGLWHDADHPCPRPPSDDPRLQPCPPCPPGHYLFHDYLHFNESKADKEKKRATNRDRMRKLRNGDHKKDDT